MNLLLIHNMLLIHARSGRSDEKRIPHQADAVLFYHGRKLFVKLRTNRRAAEAQKNRPLRPASGQKCLYQPAVCLSADQVCV